MAASMAAWSVRVDSPRVTRPVGARMGISTEPRASTFIAPKCIIRTEIPESPMARIGLLLSGCGRYDGTEVHEAVLAALALDRLGARVAVLAPAVAPPGTVDHATGPSVTA